MEEAWEKPLGNLLDVGIKESEGRDKADSEFAQREECTQVVSPLEIRTSRGGPGFVGEVAKYHLGRVECGMPTEHHPTGRADAGDGRVGAQKRKQESIHRCGRRCGKMGTEPIHGHC